jgi:hypothetical protein
MKQLCSTIALSKAGAILAFLCCCSVLANAEDISTVSVPMGKAEILARASQPFSQASSSIGRVTTIDSGADGANRYLLLYYAPNRSADYRDEITYNLNGETERMAAVVRNSPVLAGENIYQESFKALFAPRRVGSLRAFSVATIPKFVQFSRPEFGHRCCSVTRISLGLWDGHYDDANESLQCKWGLYIRTDGNCAHSPHHCRW